MLVSLCTFMNLSSMFISHDAVLLSVNRLSESQAQVFAEKVAQEKASPTAEAIKRETVRRDIGSQTEGEGQIVDIVVDEIESGKNRLERSAWCSWEQPFQRKKPFFGRMSTAKSLTKVPLQSRNSSQRSSAAGGTTEVVIDAVQQQLADANLENDFLRRNMMKQVILKILLQVSFFLYLLTLLFPDLRLRGTGGAIFRSEASPTGA